MGDHDRGYRLLFQHPKMVEDLLKGFVHESWIDDLDFSTLEHLPNVHVTDKLHRRETDMVWKLRHRGKDWLYVYILLEFQSTVDPYMALRLLVYVGLLLQRLQKQGDLVHDTHLPPVLPLVLYNGQWKWTAAREVSELFVEMPAGLARYQPRMPYLLIDEQRLRKSDLESLRNLAAALFRLEQSQGPEDMLRVTNALAEWLQDRDDLLRDFLAWITHVLLPHRALELKDQENQVPTLEELKMMLQQRTYRTWEQIAKEEGKEEGLHKGIRKGMEQGIREGMEQGIREGMEQGIREGMEQGIREGRLQGRIELLEELLEDKFGTLDPAVRSRLREATAEELLSWGARLLTADRLDEVFAG